MGVFRYKARDREGRRVDGNQDAANRDEAIRMLQSRGLLVTEVTDATVQARPAPARKRRKRIAGSDLLVFAQELATLLNSGVNLLRALEIVSRQLASQKLSTANEKIRLDIQAGSTFHDAIAKQPAFPPIWTFVVEAGELSGNLPAVLNGLAKNLETSENLKKKVASALLYPAVLICVALGAVALFVLKIIPIFAALFKNFDAELPLLTRMVIGFSAFVSKYLIVFFVLVAIAAYFLRRELGTPRGHAIVDRLLIRVPLFGSLIKDAILARISINLALLVKSGVDFLRAIDIAGKTAGNLVYQSALIRVRNDVQEGSVLSDAMDKHVLFSSMMIQMIKVGEETGRLEEMMAKIGEYYDARVTVFINRISTLIEPIVLLVVGAIVGLLVVAMFLPIFSLSSLIK